MLRGSGRLAVAVLFALGTGSGSLPVFPAGALAAEPSTASSANDPNPYRALPRRSHTAPSAEGGCLGFRDLGILMPAGSRDRSASDSGLVRASQGIAASLRNMGVLKAGEDAFLATARPYDTITIFTSRDGCVKGALHMPAADFVAGVNRASENPGR